MSQWVNQSTISQNEMPLLPSHHVSQTSAYSFIITTLAVDSFTPHLDEYSIKPTRMVIGCIYWSSKYFDLFCFHLSNSLDLSTGCTHSPQTQSKLFLIWYSNVVLPTMMQCFICCTIYFGNIYKPLKEFPRNHVTAHAPVTHVVVLILQ